MYTHTHTHPPTPTADLLPEEMEVLSGGCGVDNVHVDVVPVGAGLTAVCQLQKPLQSARRVFWASSVEAMR